MSKAIAQAIPALAKYVRHYDYIVADNGTGNYMTPEAAVDAVPAGEKTTVLILHGSYKKPAVPKNKKIKFVFWGDTRWK